MVIFYHNRDLDGKMSAAIAYKWATNKGEKPTLVGIDYSDTFGFGSRHVGDVYIRVNGDVIEVAGQEVIMLDVSMPMALMQMIASVAKEFAWIDHHKSANADFIDHFKGRCPSGITYYYNPNLSACEIAWNVFFGDEDMPASVEMIGEYDTWRDAGSNKWKLETLPFQYGMRLRQNDPEELAAHYIDIRFVDTEEIIADGVAVLKYQERQFENQCKSAFEAMIFGHRAICLNIAAGSMALDSVFDSDKHDMRVTFCAEKNGTFRVTLYSDTVDCSEIARDQGGGGHKGAAGFHVQPHELFNILKIQ